MSEAANSHARFLSALVLWLALLGLLGTAACDEAASSSDTTKPDAGGSLHDAGDDERDPDAGETTGDVAKTAVAYALMIREPEGSPST